MWLAFANVRYLSGVAGISLLACLFDVSNSVVVMLI